MDTNTFWLSQQRMAELFGVTVPTINYHLDQINLSGEIHLSDAIRKIRIPSDKWSGEVMMYNLDVVRCLDKQAYQVYRNQERTL